MKELRRKFIGSHEIKCFVAKADGGLGFWDLEAFNLPFLQSNGEG